MPKKGLFKILFAIFLIAAGITAYFSFKQATSGWDFSDSDYKAQYKDAVKSYPDSWHKITTARLAGFTPKYALSEKDTGNPYRNSAEQCNYENTDYLRTEGGICQIGYWIEANDGSVTKKLKTLDDLWGIFNPVEDEAEAVSFVAAITGDLDANADGVLEGYTKEVSGDYLVQVVRKNTFGCGNHEPTKVIYKVSKSSAAAEKSGDEKLIVKIASEKILRPESGQRICAD